MAKTELRSRFAPIAAYAVAAFDLWNVTILVMAFSKAWQIHQMHLAPMHDPILFEASQYLFFLPIAVTVRSVLAAGLVMRFEWALMGRAGISFVNFASCLRRHYSNIFMEVYPSMAIGRQAAIQVVVVDILIIAVLMHHRVIVAFQKAERKPGESIGES